MSHTVDRKMVRSWTEELEEGDERIAARFARSEVRKLLCRLVLSRRTPRWKEHYASGDEVRL